jgi:uncharacterized glyoxalase superfamily protein PhnB
MHLHPATSNPDRGILVSTLHSGSVQKAYWIDTSGVVHYFQDTFDNNGNEMMGWSRFTGNGEGTYSHHYSGATPNSFVITTHDEDGTDVAYDSVGSSTVEIEMDTDRPFTGLATFL